MSLKVLPGKILCPATAEFERGYIFLAQAWIGRRVEKTTSDRVQQIVSDIISNYLLLEHGNFDSFMNQVANYKGIIYFIDRGENEGFFITIEALLWKGLLSKLEGDLKEARDKEEGSFEQQALVKKVENFKNFVDSGALDNFIQVATTQLLIRQFFFDDCLLSVMIYLSDFYPSNSVVARVTLACLLSKLCVSRQIKRFSNGEQEVIERCPIFLLLRPLVLDHLFSICEVRAMESKRESDSDSETVSESDSDSEISMQKLLQKDKRLSQKLQKRCQAIIQRREWFSLDDGIDDMNNLLLEQLALVVTNYFPFSTSNINILNPRKMDPSQLCKKLLSKGHTVEEMICLAAVIGPEEFLELIIEQRPLAALLAFHRCCTGKFFFPLREPECPTIQKLYARASSMCEASSGFEAGVNSTSLLYDLLPVIRKVLTKVHWTVPPIEPTLTLAGKFVKTRREFLEQKTVLEIEQQAIEAVNYCNSKSEPLASRRELLEKVVCFIPESASLIVRTIFRVQENDASKCSTLSIPLYKQRSNSLIQMYSKIFSDYPARAEYFDGLLEFLYILIKKKQPQLLIPVISLLRVSAMAALIRLLFMLRFADLLYLLIEQRGSWHSSVSIANGLDIIVANMINDKHLNLTEEEIRQISPKKPPIGHDIYLKPHKLCVKESSSYWYPIDRRRLIKELKILCYKLKRPVFGSQCEEIAKRIANVFREEKSSKRVKGSDKQPVVKKRVRKSYEEYPAVYYDQFNTEVKGSSRNFD